MSTHDFTSALPGIALGGYSATPLLATLSLVLLGYLLFNHDRPHSGYKVFGLDGWVWTYKKAKAKFLVEAESLIKAGVQSGRPFQVINALGPELMFPSSYANEMKNDKRLSFKGFIQREFFPYYPGFEGSRVSMHSNLIQDTVRLRLTPSLNLVTADLCEETEFAVNKIFGNPKEWTSCAFTQVSPDLVSRLSSRVFLGPVLARDEEWLNIAVKYTIDIMRASRALKLWPSLTRPFVHWFLPECKSLRGHTRAAKRIMRDEIKRREAAWAEAAAQGKHVSKTADSLGWLQEVARETNVQTQVDYAATQLNLSFAAVHTTSDLLNKTMLRLCSNQKWIDEVRKEMVEVLTREGMKKTALYQMKYLDSLLKEVQRMEGGLATMSRTASTTIHLKDGTTIPRNASLKILNDARTDPTTFPNPDTFDPRRFLRLRSQPGQENNWQFVTTNDKSLGFGLGTHACPGRFFASNEVKIALCWLLLRYDWRLVGEAKAMKIGFEIIADPFAKMEIRAREPEVDLMGLVGVEG